jgi:ribosomal protein S18 acetylase RimI-like enzyme
MELQIMPMEKEESDAVLTLLEEIITHSFQWEGITAEEVYLSVINNQKERMESFLKTGMPYFLVAKQEKEIVGVIAYSAPEKSVQMALAKLDKENNGVVEIIASYVKPGLQRKGIGSALFEALLTTLQEKRISTYAVSTGYKKGFLFWKKKLGEPTVTLKEYYGHIDCYVWIKEIS